MEEVPLTNQDSYPSQAQVQLPNPYLAIPFLARIRRYCEHNVMCVAHPSIRTRESNIVGDESPVCGLAALNCARAILCQERTDDH